MTSLLQASRSRSLNRFDQFAPLFENSCDPVGFAAGDKNLTRYVGNSPMNITPAVQKEVDRIFQDIMNRFGAKDKNGKPCHTLTIVWTDAKTKDKYNATDFGYSGGNALGWYPTKITLGLQDTLKFGVPGQASAGSFEANLNPTKVFEASAAAGASVDIGLATVIAHELGLHALGAKVDHFPGGGSVDSEKGKTGGVFCNDAGKLITDKMDVDTR